MFQIRCFCWVWDVQYRFKSSGLTKAAQDFILYEPASLETGSREYIHECEKLVEYIAIIRTSIKLRERNSQHVDLSLTLRWRGCRSFCVEFN